MRGYAPPPPTFFYKLSVFHRICHNESFTINREFKKTTTATGTSLNKRFNEQNNGCALAF